MKKRGGDPRAPMHAAICGPRELSHTRHRTPVSQKKRKNHPKTTTRPIAIAVATAAAKDQLPPSRPPTLAAPLCIAYREPTRRRPFAEGRHDSATLAARCLPAIVCRRCDLDLCAGAWTLCRDRVGFELLLRDNLVDVWE